MEETNVEEKVIKSQFIRGQVIAEIVTVTVMVAIGVAEAAGMEVTEEVVAMTEEMEEEGVVMEVVVVAGVVMEVVAAADVNEEEVAVDVETKQQRIKFNCQDIKLMLM